MAKPQGYQGPEIEIVLKDTKAPNLPEIIDNLISTHIGSNKRVGMFLKNEQEDGDLSSTLIKRLGACGSTFVEMAAFMNKVNKIKIQPEIANLKKAAAFTEWSFKKVIKEIEDCIEGDTAIRHKKVASNLTKLLESDKINSFLQRNNISDAELLEYSLPV